MERFYLMNKKNQIKRYNLKCNEKRLECEYCDKLIYSITNKKS